MVSSLPLQGRALTIGITACSGVAFMLFGYDQGIFGGILSDPAFQEQFNHPSATLQGQIVATYDLGCVAGAFLAMFYGDRLGRRWSVLLACAFLTVGGILQSTAFSLPHMFVGRVVAGVGIGMNTTTVPMWQSETCEQEHRGKLITIQLTHLVLGFVVASWVNFGFTYVPYKQVSWRFPLGFQSFLAILTASMVPFLVESPRWLCVRGRPTAARDAIARILARPPTDVEVLAAFQAINNIVAHEIQSQKPGWRTIFTNGPQQTFHRIALGVGVNFMQQFGGVNVVAYYLPTILKRSFGFSSRMSLILAAVDSMQWMLWTALGTVLIDRIGRRKLLIVGAAGQSLCFAMMALGVGIGTKPLMGVAVAFIFLYYFFFGLSFLAIPFMYPSEVNSSINRNLACGSAMVMEWIGVYVIVSVTPVGIQNIGWKFYMVFALANFVFAPISWYFIVETARLSLEEIDKMFEIKHYCGKSMTYQEAAESAKEALATTQVVSQSEESEGKID